MVCQKIEDSENEKRRKSKSKERKEVKRSLEVKEEKEEEVKEEYAGSRMDRVRCSARADPRRRRTPSPS